MKNVLFVLLCSVMAVGACDSGDQTSEATTGDGGATTNPAGGGSSGASAGAGGRGGAGGAGTAGAPGVMTLPPGDAGVRDVRVPGTGLSADANNCGLQKFALERQPPELFLVLDRSSSMTQPVNGTVKWPAVTMAINDILMRTQMGVVWGLQLYPSITGCAVVPNGVHVPAMLNNLGPITAAIATAPPPPSGGATPTAAAVKNAALYLASRKTPNPKYILLATDGLPNCRGGSTSPTARDEAAAIGAVAGAAAAGIPTFVLGIATAGTPAHGTLNQMAVTGMKPRMDPAARYYPVASRDEVVRALETITGQITTCSFALASPPPAPNDVAADVDGKRIPRDPTNMNGWNYGPENRSIAFHGPICEQLKSGAAKNVQFIFGCPGMLIP